MAGAFFAIGLLASLTALTSADRIWMIHVGNDWGGHEYFDDKGYLKGFAMGFIDLVCSAGQMDCRIVWDTYSNCWTHNAPGERPSGGKGLMMNWYDGCLGWVPTVERIHTMQFSLPYLKQPYSFFYVTKGKESQFNPKDITGKNIAFLKGWASNEQCLARQDKVKGSEISKEQIKIIAEPGNLLTALQNGTADAFFGSDDTWTAEQMKMLHKFTDPLLSCYLNGNGVMGRKDNGLIAAWNVGFMKLRNGGKFNQFCEEANAEHGHRGKVDCIDF